MVLDTKQQPIRSFDEIIARAVSIAEQGRRKTVAVAAAQDVDVIDAVVQSHREGFLNGVLIGDESAIRQLADKAGVDLGGLEIVDVPDIKNAAHMAARFASEGKADAIMKGFMPTSALLKVVLDKAYNLRVKTTLSHCAVLDIPGYHKLLNFTDGGMVIQPNGAQKLEILENAMLVGRALGLSPIKVAVSGAVAHASEKMPHTLADTETLIPAARAKFDDIAIQGPLPFDLATDKASAQRCGLNGPVIADADIFLVDSIEECNLIAKSLIQFAQAVFAGVIVGARVPVSLVSRTDTTKNKKASLAIACVLADHYQQNSVWDKGTAS